MTANHYVFPFDHPHRHEEQSQELRRLLGGKGYWLSRLTAASHPRLRVPPGFTITTAACRQVLENGGWPPGLEEEVQAHVQELVRKSRQHRSPLLFSVRSGAARRMIGVMNTVLNVGMNEEVVSQHIATEPRFILDCHQRFLASYGHAVLGIREHDLKAAHRAAQSEGSTQEERLRSVVTAYRGLIADRRYDVPDDVDQQLRAAITAVFNSYESRQARRDRRTWANEDDIGTAVNVQVMVFGNRNQQSGSGVAYSRNPVTGKNEPAGDYLLETQGEDIVQGAANAQPIEGLLEDPEFASTADELQHALRFLERDMFQAMCEIEFTFEDRVLWLLQVREAHPSGRALLEMLRSMVEDEHILDRRSAIDKLSVPALARALHPALDVEPDDEMEMGLIARGTPVSPGVATGVAALGVDEARRLLADHRNVVLIVDRTTPDHAEIIEKVSGIVEFRQGLSSHSMVRARSYGRPFVAGVLGRIDPDPSQNLDSVCDLTLVEAPDREHRSRIHTCQEVTLDATTGRLFGAPIQEKEGVGHLDLDPLLQAVLKWVQPYQPEGFQIRASVQTGDDLDWALRWHADGIGLCRTEHLLREGNHELALIELVAAIAKRQGRSHTEYSRGLYGFFVDRFSDMFRRLDAAGRGHLPFTIRLLDQLPPRERWPSEPQELIENMGLRSLRGARIGILLEPVYALLMSALLEAAARTSPGHRRLEILIPFIIDEKEVDLVRETIRRAWTESVAKYPALRDVDLRVGAMIETPRAVLRSAEIAERVDFLHYGTNDLTALVFGTSEDDAVLWKYADSDRRILDRQPTTTLDVAVTRMLRDSIVRARRAKPGISLAIASEHAHDPDSIDFFLEHHFNFISCIPRLLPVARLAVAKAHLRQESSLATGRAG